MFVRASALVLAIAAIAIAAPGATSTGTNQCNTGPVQCCNNYETAGSDSAVGGLLGLLGIPTGTIVGLGCTAIPIVGKGASCDAAPMCCENNDSTGFIVVDCSPINLAL